MLRHRRPHNAHQFNTFIWRAVSVWRLQWNSNQKWTNNSFHKFPAALPRVVRRCLSHSPAHMTTRWNWLIEIVTFSLWHIAIIRKSVQKKQTFFSVSPHWFVRMNELTRQSFFSWRHDEFSCSFVLVGEWWWMMVATGNYQYKSLKWKRIDGGNWG